MRQFRVSDVEEERALRWIRKHIRTCEQAKIERAKHGPRAPMEFIEYVFTGTPIANAVSARCSCCREEVGVTDYSTW